MFHDHGLVHMPNNHDISRLRVLVGYLGEREQSHWWSSSFLGRTSGVFLAPVFANAAGNTRLIGVTEAARRVHDEAIGVGRAFHLFRLPQTLERELHRTISAAADVSDIDSVDEALDELKELSSGDAAPRSGPMHVGTVAMLDNAEWVAAVASHYVAAFKVGFQTFPYFAR